MFRNPFDPRSPSSMADPYPQYAFLRAHDPVQHVPSAGLWFISRMADCKAALTDPAFSAAGGQLLRARHGPLPPTMLTADPPEHTRLRSGASEAFTGTALRALIPHVQQVVADRVDAVLTPASPGRVIDLVTDLALPISTSAHAALLGLGPDGLERLVEHVGAASRHLDPFARDPAAESATSALLDLFADELQAHRAAARPQTHALSVVAAAFDDGRMDASECLATAALLVVGGVEPLAELLRQMLAAELAPDRVAGASVEAALRDDAPIQFTARRVRERRVLAGRVLDPGQSVVLLLGSANRDEQRRAGTHLSFGAGPHRCLGAPFARLVARITATHLRRLGASAVPVVEGCARRRTSVPRGYLRFPVELR